MNLFKLYTSAAILEEKISSWLLCSEYISFRCKQVTDSFPVDSS